MRQFTIFVHHNKQDNRFVYSNPFETSFPFDGNGSARQVECYGDWENNALTKPRAFIIHNVHSAASALTAAQLHMETDLELAPSPHQFHYNENYIPTMDHIEVVHKLVRDYRMIPVIQNVDVTKHKVGYIPLVAKSVNNIIDVKSPIKVYASPDECPDYLRLPIESKIGFMSMYTGKPIGEFAYFDRYNQPNARLYVELGE